MPPLVEEDTPLLDFYVMPDINSVEVKRVRGGGKEERKLLSSFRSVFYKTDKLCSEIYLTAESGLGKTTLCKRLALAWCHAKNPLRNEKRYFSKEEIEVMNEFRFIFLLLLRDCAGQCDIDDMIMNQIVSRLTVFPEFRHKYDSEYLKNILCKETCLVILDGLDEWTHPANCCKPQKSMEVTAVLTTTRPWKFGLVGLKSSDIDQRLEITGLNHESSSTLKRSVISHLSGEKDADKLERYVFEFSRAVHEKQISDLEAVPLLLMYLLYLWHCRIELGQSQCDLYSKIIELLLSITIQKYKDISSLAEPSQGEIPQCFSTQTRCKQFYSLLTALGQLAFQTLFRETREENMLVFDSSVAEQYLNKDYLAFCLRTGIITQNKVQGNPMKQELKVSFAHKTVQEFFAALYMHSNPDQTSVPEIVTSKCKCVKDILDMSIFFKFIIGMNMNVASSISREMMKIINEDEITQEYRNTLGLNCNSNLLKDFQDMCISCCQDFPLECEPPFRLQDIFIDESSCKDQYRVNLEHLTRRNQQNIRSLYINMNNMPDTTFRAFIEELNYYVLQNIEKIHYESRCYKSAILPLLNKSVMSLYLSFNDIGRSSWFRLLLKKMTNLQELNAIGISGINISHSELTLLFDLISHRHCMREIELRGLICTDHEMSCRGCCLDLSLHLNLRKLSLISIPLSVLIINMNSLERYTLRYLSCPDLALQFVNCDPAESRLNILECGFLKSFQAIETILDTLPLLVNLEDIVLGNINLRNRSLPLCIEMKNVGHIGLWLVTLSASALRHLVDVIYQLPQTVTVDLDYCKISPLEEFEVCKREIKISPCFKILADGDNSFVFEKPFIF